MCFVAYRSEADLKYPVESEDTSLLFLLALAAPVSTVTHSNVRRTLSCIEIPSVFSGVSNL
jgi:hypothetical protein